MAKRDREIVSSGTSLTHSRVVGTDGEDLGRVEELMIDLRSGRVAYAVVSFGGFLGFGDELFAIPFPALALDAAGERFQLGATREQLAQAGGFPKDRWPDFTDRRWAEGLHRHFGVAAPG